MGTPGCDEAGDGGLSDEESNRCLLNQAVSPFHGLFLVSLDQPQKKSGAKRTYHFINEAKEFNLEDWIQLSIRTEKQIFIDYNPSMEEHWIYDLVIPRKDCTFIQSTYLDNMVFLPAEVVKEIEQLKYIDENYWRVYGLGLPPMSLLINLIMGLMR